MYLVITTVVNYQLQVPCYVAKSASELYVFYQPAGPKIAWYFPNLSVCASPLITCTIIMSRALLQCNFASVNLTAALSTVP